MRTQLKVDKTYELNQKIDKNTWTQLNYLYFYHHKSLLYLYWHYFSSTNLLISLKLTQRYFFRQNLILTTFIVGCHPFPIADARR